MTSELGPCLLEPRAMTRLRFAALLVALALVAAFGLSSVAPHADAATITGGDKGGADITVANGDVLSGTLTNVGTFTIPAGVTVTVAPGTALSITAVKIVIDGVLDGTGQGSAGGQPTTGDSDPGVAGSGPGAGGGGGFGACVHGSGGGGGGYGGAGGDSSLSDAGGG